MSTPAFLLRQARLQDHAAIFRLARGLDSTTLPTDSSELSELLKRSARSFAGKIRDRSEARYVFCAEDIRRRRVVAASVIIGKHGTPASPHYFLEVGADERYSHTLERMFRHTYLRLRYSMDGPTELGGLIVNPLMRGHPERVGRQISWVRFAYIARHRNRFEKQVLAEMLPPTEPGHRNRFWDHYGRRMTGLTYRDADRLSMRDKEFIHALFPDAPIYLMMLPEEVRGSIGEVGENARGALKILEQAGMKFLHQIDPFDGGPYYGCETKDLEPVKACGRYRALAGEPTPDSPRYLIAFENPRGYRAVASSGEIIGRRMKLPPQVLAVLGLKENDPFDAVPLP